MSFFQDSIAQYMSFLQCFIAQNVLFLQDFYRKRLVPPHSEAELQTAPPIPAKEIIPSALKCQVVVIYLFKLFHVTCYSCRNAAE
jgi:hypothetical protein